MTTRSDLDDLIDGRLTWRDLVARLGYDADEEALFRDYLRRAGVRAREHVADARAARRAAGIRADAAAEIPHLLGLPADTTVLLSDDYESPNDLLSAIDEKQRGTAPFAVLLVVTGIVEVYARGPDGVWTRTRHRI